jgi:hypothetical protein
VIALLPSLSRHAEMREDGSPLLRDRRNDMVEEDGAEVVLELELVRAKVDPVQSEASGAILSA